MNRQAGCAATLARLSALALAFLLAISLPASLVAHAVGQVLFSPTRIADVITAEVVDSGLLRRLVNERLLSGEGRGEGGGPEIDLAKAMGFLEPDEVGAILDGLLPADWAKGQITALLEGLYAWIDSDQPTPDLAVDILPLKEALVSGGAERLVESLVDSWPACAVEQVNRIANSAAARGEVLLLLYCEPPEPYRTDLTRMATASLVRQAELMPSKIAFGSELRTTGNPEDLQLLKERIRLARAISLSSWLLSLSLLGFIMALIVRSWQGLTRWWGVPLLIGGLLTFASGLVGGGLARRFLLSASANQQAPDILSGLVKTVTDGIFSAMVGRLYLQALLVCFAAVLLLGSGLIVRGRRQEVPGADEMRAVSSSESENTQ